MSKYATDTTTLEDVRERAAPKPTPPMPKVPTKKIRKKDSLPSFEEEADSSSSKEDPAEWTDQIERTVREIVGKARRYKKVHQDLSLVYSNRYFYMMLSLIVLSPLSTTFTVLGLLDFASPLAFNTAAAIASFASGIVASFLKFGRYDETSADHKRAASRYITLSNTAKMQLALSPKDRVGAGKFLHWIVTAYDSLYETSPLITSSASVRLDTSDCKEDVKEELVVPRRADAAQEKMEQGEPISVLSGVKEQEAFMDLYMRYQMSRLEVEPKIN